MACRMIPTKQSDAARKTLGERGITLNALASINEMTASNVAAQMRQMNDQQQWHQVATNTKTEMMTFEVNDPAARPLTPLTSKPIGWRYSIQ